ncbi:NAD-dependent epimerase/dehydratase family protein [Agrobacterium vitis]|uniref:NAD-dependent epimerase/dehydratase family protein n=1 Tax=Agrobacterium vitis TaxID=373 RepID=UPI000872744E|nr:NAD-dependent epimerase/dehydratase family protein [Agrobacterium vitis]MCM2470945.1 NAD(P)-dependent oxidoreductase [Agrobacterium vitis]MUO70063.1 NAD-dependent epimerase/dehydratase family protein [Agrobacterium vitis]
MAEKTSIIFGCNGRIGSLLFHTLRAQGETVFGIDGSLDIPFSLLTTPAVVYHCAGNADPNAAIEQHVHTVTLAKRVLSWCAEAKVPKVYLCGSSWADPITDDREQNERTAAYGAAKRAIRDMAATYPGDARYVRLGWYPATPMPDDAPDWLKREYWTAQDVLRAFDL